MRHRRSRTRAFRLGVALTLVTAALLAPRVGRGLDPDQEGAPLPVPPAESRPKDATAEDDAPLGPPRLTPSTRAIPFTGGAGKKVYVVRIEDTIDLGLAPFLDRVLEEARAAGDVAAVILEIDTPGGRVDAAVQMKDALLEAEVPTIAFVHTQAISAGALIAYAHDFIVVSEGASMGAATPIQLGGGGAAEPVEEKMTSYMRGVMRATAEAKGRDGDIAEAMVDASIHVPGVNRKGKLVTASKRQLLDWGIADQQAASLDGVLRVMRLEGAELVRPTPNWAERIARFLTDPTVSSLLMTLGFLGIIIEISSPGFGLPGALGIASLLAFFFGHLVVRLAGIEEVLLFALGIGLLALEVFVIPGFGIVGALGIGAIAVSLVLALLGLPLDVSLDSGALLLAVGQVAIAGILTTVLAVAALKILPRTGAGRRLVLAAVSGEGGPATHDAPLGRAAPERPETPEAAAALVGATGEALTDLRPAGRALVGGTRLDVVTEGDYVKKGARVEVVEAGALRVVVRERREEGCRP